MSFRSTDPKQQRRSKSGGGSGGGSSFHPNPSDPLPAPEVSLYDILLTDEMYPKDVNNSDLAGSKVPAKSKWATNAVSVITLSSALVATAIGLSDDDTKRMLFQASLTTFQLSVGTFIGLLIPKENAQKK